MKLSIIVPVYNVEKYVEKCIESLVKQTLDDIEIIIVDDGSTDSSYEIAKKFATGYPDKIKLFQKENEGQASARNLALSVAQGEYLGFVDSDDWVDYGMYEEMYELAKKENADIVVCDMIDHYLTSQVYHHSSDMRKMFRTTPSACNKIFRKKIVGGDVFPHGLWYEDFEFTTKQLIKANIVVGINKGFYHCHCREVSTMNNDNSEKNLDILIVLDHLIEFISEMKKEDELADVIEYMVLDHILITSINRVSVQRNPQKKIVIKKMREYVKLHYPHMTKDDVFCELGLNRKMIAWFNYCGMHQISRVILGIKGKLTKKS